MSTLELGGAEIEADTVAKAICALATQVKYLGTGDAATSMGAIEHLAAKIEESASTLAEAVTDAASTAADATSNTVDIALIDVIEKHGENVRAGLESLATSINVLTEELTKALGR